MIIHEGNFLNKIKKGLKTYNKPEKPKEFEGTEAISEKDFNKIIADINSIGSQYEKLCDKYDMSLVTHSSLDQAKKDFKAGKSAGLKASYVFAGGTYYDSFLIKRLGISLLRSLTISCMALASPMQM